VVSKATQNQAKELAERILTETDAATRERLTRRLYDLLA
jgi:hypothetical protein